jgi:hypothetical protein
LCVETKRAPCSARQQARQRTARMRPECGAGTSIGYTRGARKEREASSRTGKGAAGEGGGMQICDRNGGHRWTTPCVQSVWGVRPLAAGNSVRVPYPKTLAKALCSVLKVNGGLAQEHEGSTGRGVVLQLVL